MAESNDYQQRAEGMASFYQNWEATKPPPINQRNAVYGWHMISERFRAAVMNQLVDLDPKIGDAPEIINWRRVEEALPEVGTVVLIKLIGHGQYQMEAILRSDRLFDSWHITGVHPQAVEVWAPMPKGLKI